MSVNITCDRRANQMVNPLAGLETLANVGGADWQHSKDL